MTGKPCHVKGEDKVLHTVWGRRGTVESIRELATPRKGSRWMVRVKWEDGGWGVDGDSNFALLERPKVRRVLPGEREEKEEAP